MAVDIKMLHIGSHVLMNGVRAKVVRLNTVKYSEVETFHILVRGISPETGAVGECGCFADDKAVQPIPITPELLAELGFQYRDNTYWERWFLGSFDIERKEGSSYFDYNSEIRLEDLHELEDLYNLVYGVELIKE